MSLYQDFGNVNSIVCRMINFFKEIMFCFKSVLWFTIGPNFKIWLWVWALSQEVLFYTAQGTCQCNLWYT